LISAIRFIAQRKFKPASTYRIKQKNSLMKLANSIKALTDPKQKKQEIKPENNAQNSSKQFLTQL